MGGEEHLLFERIEHELELLQRHTIVLQKVIDGMPIGIRKIADETNIPEHKIRYSLRVLEQKGMITPTQYGASPTEKAIKFKQQLGQKIKSITDQLQRLG